MELTKEKAIEEHRKMWNWIADEIIKRGKPVGEKEYIKLFFPEEQVESQSFLCEFVGRDEECGDECPLDWGITKHCSGVIRKREEGKIVETIYGLYLSYIEYAFYHKNCEKASEIAREIANLPEKSSK